MAKVIMLCGRIASGKTTYAKELEKKQKVMVLSSDDIMLSLFDECLGEKHERVESACREYLYAQAEKLVGLGIDVVLDLGFWRREDRVKVRNYFGQRGIECLMYYFDIPAYIREERLWERNRRLSASPRREYIISKEMLERFDSEFEEPLDGEADNIISN